MKTSHLAGAFVLTLGLAACGDQEVLLDGERLDLRAPITEAQIAAAEAAPEISTAISLPATQNIASWSHASGSATHTAPHAALSGTLTRVWSVNIGTGNSRKRRITASPVSDGSRIYTLDALATLTAVTTGGQVAWSRDLIPEIEGSEVSGGGIAVGDGQVFVTTGYGELQALDAATGAMIWEQDLDAAATGAPTVVGKLVYVVSRDNRAWAVDTSTGRIRWEVPGLPAAAGVIGGAGPAVDDRLAIFPFSSGELIGVFRQGGVRIWTSSILGQRKGRAYASLNDLSAAPVVADGKVFVGNASGRVVALDAGNGDRLWTAREGAYGTVLPVGGSVFLISDQGRLMRLDAETGTEIWAETLPHFKREKTKRRKGVFAHYGPLLAGGQLIVASSDGLLRRFSPESGALIGATDLPGDAASDPIVVGGTLYLVTENGQLHAFR